MNILLAVTGSISAYKALDICRGLTKARHNVRVLCSKGAEEFINPNAFHYLGAEKVYRKDDDFNLNQYESDTNVLHIDLVKWAHNFIISPASANTLAKIANGFCDDLISSVFLALGEKPCLIFPAMNTKMLTHPMTQENLNKLQSLSNVFIHPTDSGELACGDIGSGKLARVEQVVDVILSHTLKSNGKTVLITTGATISPLDPVRYITNPSSGKTGYEFSKKYLSLGYKVILIHGFQSTPEILNLESLPNFSTVQASTTREMQEAVFRYFDSADIYISTAAMSDIEFPLNSEKLKKSSLESSLEFSKAPDVLASVLEKRKNQIIIGFAAETSSNSDVFLEKWKRKPVDLLVGNIVNSGTSGIKQGFTTDENEYFFIKDGQVLRSQYLSKSELALEIEKEAF
jgi:phosphopantothenoylcysteine decarboxylase/phosphopantothenate--cysteine ligase